MISIIIQILLISVSVAMDAFAVSIGKGLTVSRVRVQDAVKSTLWFGGFQMLFPILGYFAASTFSKYVTQFDHWIIFALLVFIGGNMVHEAFEEDEENSKETAQFDWKHMLPLAVACSIGVVTGLFSAAGLHIGRAFGSRWQKPAQIAGGVVLILLGIKVLLEHLGVIAF
jgi:putative Mn2+ efflux pump MntP